MSDTEKDPDGEHPKVPREGVDKDSDPDLEPGPTEQNQSARYSSFSTWQKRAIVLCAATTALFSPLSAQIYLPALTSISDDLDVTSSQINLTITTYMIVQGIIPIFVGSLADSCGRRPAYVACFIVYIAANIGLALAPNYGAILGLRCLQSAGSSGTVALCIAVVADVVTSAERGSYVGFTSVPAVLGPSLGPVIGGLLSKYLGWRSIFWFLVILAGVTFVFVVLFLPETCRTIVGDGSQTPPLYRTFWQMIKSQKRRFIDKKGMEAPAGNSQPGGKLKLKFPNLLGSLLMLLEKETGILLSTSSITFAGFYTLAAAMPSQLTDEYGLDEIQVGLMYLPLAGGSVVASALVGRMMTWSYRRHCARLGVPFDRKRQQDLAEFPIERARMEVGLPLVVLGSLSLIAWGWAMDAHAHLAVPGILTFFLGIGMIGFNNTTSTLLVDIHPGKPGTATAANNFTRCLVGAGATAAIVPMIDGIGMGWAFTLMGGLYGLCLPVLWLIMARGMTWRAELREREEAKRAGRYEAGGGK